ncbi:MAG TPA: restriction endonuclease subunit S [Burkholderiaceae bacterium]|nr:restriction endonuclease subunit S [Burkholderiaceae bacterium]
MTGDAAFRRLADVVVAKAGNNKIIKGTQSDRPRSGLVQGFSASGPDVWVATADYTRPGVVLSAVGARCGKTFLAEGAWTAIANTHVLLPSPLVDHRWLWYLTNDESFWVRGGSAQPFVKVKDTLQKEVKVPPLREQQRIVAILDEAFEGIATAKANAEKNQQNACDLLDNHLKCTFRTREEMGAEVQIGSVCQRLHQGLNTAGVKIKFQETGYPIIQTRNIEDGIINLDEKIKFVSKEDWNFYKEKFRPEIGDVFFTNIGTIGKTAIIAEDCEYLIHWNIFKLRPKFKSISSAYLKYALENLTKSGYFKSMQKGGTVDFITKAMISEAHIFLPSIIRQAEITAELDSLREETQRLESNYQSKLGALADLKNSLLSLAFTGAL